MRLKRFNSIDEQNPITSRSNKIYTFRTPQLFSGRMPELKLFEVQNNSPTIPYSSPNSIKSNKGAKDFKIKFILSQEKNEDIQEYKRKKQHADRERIQVGQPSVLIQEWPDNSINLDEQKREQEDESFQQSFSLNLRENKSLRNNLF